MRQAVTRKPKVRIYANGKCTISGLDYSDMRSLLTKASLYQYDHPYKPRKHNADTEKMLPGIQARNDAAERAWHAKMRWISDTLDKSMAAAIATSHGPSTPVSLKARLLQNKKDREELQRIYRELGLVA